MRHKMTLRGREMINGTGKGKPLRLSFNLDVCLVKVFHAGRPRKTTRHKQQADIASVKGVTSREGLERLL